MNFQAGKSSVESKVTSRRLSAWQEVEPIVRRAGSFQRLGCLRQRRSVRLQTRSDLSKQSGEDSKLFEGHIRAFPAEASALSATFGQIILLGHGWWGLSATQDVSHQVMMICVQLCERLHRSNSAKERLPSSTFYPRVKSWVPRVVSKRAGYQLPVTHAWTTGGGSAQGYPLESICRRGRPRKEAKISHKPQELQGTGGRAMSKKAGFPGYHGPTAFIFGMWSRNIYVDMLAQSHTKCRALPTRLLCPKPQTRHFPRVRRRFLYQDQGQKKRQKWLTATQNRPNFEFHHRAQV